MPRYEVVNPISHGTGEYESQELEAGDTIELTEEEAAPLLQAGTITEAGRPKDSRAGYDPDNPATDDTQLNPAAVPTDATQFTDRTPAAPGTDPQAKRPEPPPSRAETKAETKADQKAEPPSGRRSDRER